MGSFKNDTINLRQSSGTSMERKNVKSILRTAVLEFLAGIKMGNCVQIFYMIRTLELFMKENVINQIATRVLDIDCL